MNVVFKSAKKRVEKFQVGGVMPETTNVLEAPATTEANQDPMVMLVELSMLALETQDCQVAMLVCQALVELAQGTTSVEEPVGEPVFKKGGQLVRRIKK